MKIIVFILSIIIAGQAFVPCSDGNTCEREAKISTSHDHSDDHEDACTLFCVCHCCGSTITFPQHIEEQWNSIDLPEYAIGFLNSLYSYDFNGAIWRPPSVI